MFCFVVGCGTDFDQKNDGIARICPKCHNAAVVRGTKKTYLEFCFVPLPFLPLSKKDIWLCPVCQWFLSTSRGEPQRVGGPPAYQQGPPGAYYQQPGYGNYPGQGK
ncbi:hypothetical protein FRC20_008595 [Serendipita sp. 405]|nr:hypothetical protein FRC16_008189 [Serendipita sp. 398]KAG8784023.1 hypothetical protein FRC15_004145 [Serendipita sp. 397]KAG8829745.1 hypothetical protein FRC20_008595 [Serendipita sp. 405]